MPARSHWLTARVCEPCLRRAVTKIKQVINDINYALLYNLLRQRDSKRTKSMLGAKNPHTPLLHYDTDEMALLMSFRVRQRPGRKVKISACLLSSKMDMQFSPLQLAHRGAGGDNRFIHVILSPGRFHFDNTQGRC